MGDPKKTFSFSAVKWEPSYCSLGVGYFVKDLPSFMKFNSQQRKFEIFTNK